MRRWGCLVLLLGLPLAACQRHSAPAASAVPQAQAPIAESGDGDWRRVWEGVLPCADCRGIQTRLELRRSQGQQTYRLEEFYLGDGEPSRFEQHGAWQERRAGTEVSYQLDPDRFGAVYQLQEDGALLLRDRASQDDIPDYRLQRQ